MRSRFLSSDPFIPAVSAKVASSNFRDATLRMQLCNRQFRVTVTSVNHHEAVPSSKSLVSLASEKFFSLTFSPRPDPSTTPLTPADLSGVSILAQGGTHALPRHRRYRHPRHHRHAVELAAVAFSRSTSARLPRARRVTRGCTRAGARAGPSLATSTVNADTSTVKAHLGLGR